MAEQLPDGIEVGYRLAPGTPLPDGWEILIDKEWFSADKRSTPMGHHPLAEGYSYPQHVRPIEVEKVCKYLKPGEVCKLHNLQCQAPACMVPKVEERKAADGTPVPHWADPATTEDPSFDQPNAAAWWRQHGRPGQTWVCEGEVVGITEHGICTADEPLGHQPPCGWRD